MGFVIAVDGPAASGKGTIAHRLGEAYGYPVLDSGLLYRAVGVRVLAEGGDPDDADIAAAIALTLDPAELERPEVRTPWWTATRLAASPAPRVRTSGRSSSAGSSVRAMAAATSSSSRSPPSSSTRTPTAR